MEYPTKEDLKLYQEYLKNINRDTFYSKEHIQKMMIVEKQVNDFLEKKYNIN